MGKERELNASRAELASWPLWRVDSPTYTLLLKSSPSGREKGKDLLPAPECQRLDTQPINSSTFLCQEESPNKKPMVWAGA